MKPATLQISKELKNQGVKWGDAIAWATKQLGLTQCPPCKARQKILNEARQFGLVETVKRIKETL